MRSSGATATRRAGRTAPARHVASRGRGGRRSRLRVVRPPRPRPRRGRRLGRMAFLVMSFVVVGLLVFGVVTLQAILSQTSFRMRELERRSSQLQENYGQLKLDVAQLSAPGRIAREAKRLGLKLPDRVETISVDDPATTRGNQPQGAPPSFALKGVLGEEP